jgi:hypothetical protein
MPTLFGQDHLVDEDVGVDAHGGEEVLEYLGGGGVGPVVEDGVEIVEMRIYGQSVRETWVEGTKEQMECCVQVLTLTTCGVKKIMSHCLHTLHRRRDNDCLISVLEDDSAIQTALETGSHRVVPLDIPYAFHSAQLDCVLYEYEHLAERVTFKETKIPIISPLVADYDFDGKTVSAKYMSQASRHPVQFLDALNTARAVGIVDDRTVWLEIGPHPICCNNVKSWSGGQANTFGSLRQGEDIFSPSQELLQACSNLVCRLHGRSIGGSSNVHVACCLCRLTDGVRKITGYNTKAPGLSTRLFYGMDFRKASRGLSFFRRLSRKHSGLHPFTRFSRGLSCIALCFSIVGDAYVYPAGSLVYLGRHGFHCWETPIQAASP